MASPCSIILADDHVNFREVLKDILEEVEGLHVIGEAGDGLDLLGLFRDLNPELIILDISMPKLNGIEAARQLKTISPQVKILLLTSHEERQYLNEAISAGVDGYILKRDLPGVLFSAINTIRQGGSYFSPLIFGKLPEFIKE